RCLFFTLQRTTRSPLFPYTTLFRSGRTAHRIADKRFVSLEDLIARTGMQRDEVVTLADIGALNSFGYDRRSALWQAERAIRPTRSEEHTSELQSLAYLVCRLLLEKK